MAAYPPHFDVFTVQEKTNTTMTCVWDSLISSIPDEEMRRVLGVEKSRMHPRRFVEALQARNRRTSGVLWQGHVLREQEMKENREWIGDYNVAGINGGHNTSAADPFLCLICDLFGAAITHNYCGHIIRFSPAGGAPRFTIHVVSNTSHMSRR